MSADCPGPGGMMGGSCAVPGTGRSPLDPFVIVGVPRSGTTVLSVLLDNHPAVHVPSRTPTARLENVHRHLLEALTTTGDAREVDPHGWIVKALRADERLAGVVGPVPVACERPIREALRSGLLAAARSQGAAVFGDKAPPLLMNLPLLTFWIPGVRIVHLIRDGRAVALSNQKRFGTDPRLAIQRWKYQLFVGRAMARVLPRDQYLELHFEELVARPRDTLETVCEFLGLPFHEAMLDLESRGETGNVDSYVRPTLSPEVVGRWRTAFDRRTLEGMERIAGDCLTGLGYPLLVLPEGGPFRMLSAIEVGWLVECHLLRGLLTGTREVMKDRKVERWRVPVGERLQRFVRGSFRNAVNTFRALRPRGRIPEGYE
jgi:hypothetical protein